MHLRVSHLADIALQAPQTHHESKLGMGVHEALLANTHRRHRRKFQGSWATHGKLRIVPFLQSYKATRRVQGQIRLKRAFPCSTALVCAGPGNDSMIPAGEVCGVHKNLGSTLQLTFSAEAAGIGFVSSWPQAATAKESLSKPGSAALSTTHYPCRARQKSHEAFPSPPQSAASPARP